MRQSGRKAKGHTADRALVRLAAAARPDGRASAAPVGIDHETIAELVAADLVTRRPDGGLQVTAAGRARADRLDAARADAAVDAYRGQHIALVRRRAPAPDGSSDAAVPVNDAESPLAWLARRKGKDGRAMIEPAQFQAGERLRADFTFAQLMPRMTVDWASPIAAGGGAGGGGPAAMADAAVAARQRLHRALEAAGPEFAGLLVDVCCFLKGLEDAERERGWPPRSAKVVLQLGLDRLVRHYGLAREARGPSHAPLRAWLAPGERFLVGGEDAEA